MSINGAFDLREKFKFDERLLIFSKGSHKKIHCSFHDITLIMFLIF